MNANTQSTHFFSLRRYKFFRLLKHWFRSRSFTTKLDLFVFMIAFLMGLMTYAALNGIFFDHDAKTVIRLLTIDVVVLFTLTILIGRRVVKAWVGRKSKTTSSKLHRQLVFTFGILTAIPAILMTLFSTIFFYYGIQEWFGNRVRTAIENSITVAQAYLVEHQQLIRADSLAMASDFSQGSVALLTDPIKLERFIATQSYLRNLPEIALFRKDGFVLAKTSLTTDLDLKELLEADSLSNPNTPVLILNDAENERVRAIVNLPNQTELFMYVGRPVDERVLDYLTETKAASKQYAALETESSSFQLTITFAFILISVLMILFAIWLGLLISKRLVQPIDSLVETTKKISDGDLSVRIDKKVSNNIREYNALANAFNKMTERLAKQRDELLKANEQVNERRRFSEAVLSGVSSGILGLDKTGKISLINENALEILQIDSKKIKNKRPDTVFPEIVEILKKAEQNRSTTVKDYITWYRKDGSKRKLFLRFTFSKEDGKNAVITFDDVTGIEAAQRNAAWSDVARRIAHEIKNPLTPIHLATERLKRKYSDNYQDKDKEIFDRCTDTIIQHVEDIQNMVNAFSSFARMPLPKFSKVNVNDLINDIIVFQKQAHPNIIFEYSYDNLIEVELDKNLINQLITNIIKNSIEAIFEKEKSAEGKINIIQTNVNDDDYEIKVIDNGAGISKELNDTISDPYITTKETGSGLGLAIVKRIAEDHNGSFVIRSISKDEQKLISSETGAVVILTFPKEQKE